MIVFKLPLYYYVHKTPHIVNEICTFLLIPVIYTYIHTYNSIYRITVNLAIWQISLLSPN